MRQGGILESWWKYTSTSGTYTIVGKIFGDSNWTSGRTIRTSTVDRIEMGKIYTRNTVYRLGAERKENRC